MEAFLGLSPFAQALIASLLAGSATGLGALPVFALQEIRPQARDIMLGFGAGVMLAAAFFSLLNPSLEAGIARFSPESLALAVVVVGFLFGGLLFYFADRLLPHEHFVAGPEGADPGELRRIWLFVIAITIHNFPEGLAVGVGLGSGEASNGIALALGIGLQNMPEGLVVAMALISEGYRRGHAFFIALLTGLVEPIGGALGAGILMVADPLLPLMLALAAGAMVYVISDEIIPESHRKGYPAVTSSLMIGFVIMMFLDVSLS